MQIGDGDVLTHQGSAEEEDPERGEGKAADSGEEGHGAGKVDIPMEHGSLGSKYPLICLDKANIYPEV